MLDCFMLKSVLVPSLLLFTQLHHSSFFINLSDSYCNIFDMAYSNYSTEGIQWQGYIAINIMRFNSLTILTKNQIPIRYTSDFPILPHQPPSAPRSLSKSSPMDGSAFA